MFGRDNHENTKQSFNMPIGEQQCAIFDRNEQADHEHKATRKGLGDSRTMPLMGKERIRKQGASLMVMDTVQPGGGMEFTNGFTVAWKTSRPIQKLLAAAKHLEVGYILESLKGLRVVRSTRLTQAWLQHRTVAKRSKRIELQGNQPAGTRTPIVGSMRILSRFAQFRLSLAFMLIATLIGPATAFDNEIALHQYPGAATFIVPDPGPRLPIGLVGTYILVVAGLLTTTAQNLLGPLMGISSVLWFIMRNDTAIKPSVSWA